MKRGYLFIACLISISLLLIACASGQQTNRAKVMKNRPKQNRMAFYQFDVTGSTVDERNELFETFKALIATHTYGDIVVVGMITSDSLKSSRLVVELEIPKFVWDKQK